MISARKPARRWFSLPLPSRQFSATQRRNSGADLGRIALLWPELLGTWAFRTASLLVGYPTLSALRPADLHGTRSPSPARRGAAKPSRTSGAFALRPETLRLDSISNETLRPLPASEPRADRHQEQTDTAPDFRHAEEFVAKTGSPSPVRPGRRSRREPSGITAGAFGVETETLRLDSVSNETSNAGNRPAIPLANGDHLPILS